MCIVSKRRRVYDAWLDRWPTSPTTRSKNAPTPTEGLPALYCRLQHSDASVKSNRIHVRPTEIGDCQLILLLLAGVGLLVRRLHS